MIRQIILLSIACILCYNSYGQIKFEKGYFIDNQGVKTECFIRNKEWNSNPTTFKYSATIDSDIKTKTIQGVQEFGILGKSKYKRFEVSIDRSKDRINDLSSDKEPQFSKEIIFLKVLVEGDAVLYRYIEGSFIRFFYSVKDSQVTQLIHKRYLSEEGTVGENNYFRRQLWSDLRCKNAEMKEVLNLNYYDKSLTKYFIKYNTCLNPDFKIVEKKRKPKEIFNINIRPGLNQSKLTLVDNPISPFSRDIDFESNQSFRMGLEIEYILPFNKGKWSVFMEPTYQSYKSDEREVDFLPQSVRLRTVVASADYKSVELPIGLRHSIFINDQSKVFLSGSFVFDFPLDSNVDLIADIPREVNGTNFDLIDDEITSSSSLAFGIGYKYKKYSVELRYLSNRDIFNEDRETNSEYQTTSLIFGYTIF